MSFCWCFSGNAGANVPATMLGPFSANIGDAMAPKETTSSSVAGSRSLFSASVSPSANAPIMLPMIMFTTSFIFAP